MKMLYFIPEGEARGGVCEKRVTVAIWLVVLGVGVPATKNGPGFALFSYWPAAKKTGSISGFASFWSEVCVREPNPHVIMTASCFFGCNHDWPPNATFLNNSR